MVLLDINMPTCCADCPLFNDRYDYPTCYITQESRGYNFKIHEKRMPTCPLREQTKAGRIVRPKSLGFDIIGKHEKVR